MLSTASHSIYTKPSPTSNMNVLSQTTKSNNQEGQLGTPGQGVQHHPNQMMYSNILNFAKRAGNQTLQVMSSGQNLKARLKFPAKREIYVGGSNTMQTVEEYVGGSFGGFTPTVVSKKVHKRINSSLTNYQQRRHPHITTSHSLQQTQQTQEAEDVRVSPTSASRHSGIKYQVASVQQRRPQSCVNQARVRNVLNYSAAQPQQQHQQFLLNNFSQQWRQQASMRRDSMTTLKSNMQQHSLLDASQLCELDDTDHLDTQGLRIRRNKVVSELSMIQGLKHQTSQQLLQVLFKLEKLGQKAKLNKNDQQMAMKIITEGNEDEIKKTEGSTSVINNLPQCTICCKPVLNSSQENIQEEVESMLKGRKHQMMLMQFTEQKLFAQLQKTREEVTRLEKSISQADQRIIELKFSKKVDDRSSNSDNSRGIKRKVLLLISQLKKHVYDDLTQYQEDVVEPYTGPLKSNLRSDKPNTSSSSPTNRSPRKRQRSVESAGNGEKIMNDYPIKEDSSQTEIPLGQGMTDNKEELRKRLERMEGQLRKKTDRYLTSAGECMELVLDYRKYESTKVDQFQELIRKAKLKEREQSAKEVEKMFNERKALQLEAYRLASFMQKRIERAVKSEADQIMHIQ